MLRALAAVFMSTLLSGYGFDEQHGPYFVLDDLAGGQTRRTRVYVRNAPLTLSATEQRYCTGSFDLDSYEASPCPEQAQVKADLETCFSCFRRTGFNPSFYNVPKDTISAQQLAYNERPHVVYLAYFAEGCVKVGISSQDRMFSRWRGQGARLATRLVSAEDAYAAREIEERVAREGGLPEALRGSRKRQLLNLPLDVASATNTLEVTRQRLARELDIHCAEASIHDLTRDYLGSHGLDLPVTDVSDEASPNISGTGIGMVGDVLLVEESRRQYMLSLKDLIGRVISVEATVRPNRRRPTAGQLGFNFG